MSTGSSTGSFTRAAAGVVVAGAAVLFPGDVSGQSDFLVERPKLTVSVFGGWATPGEGSASVSDVFQHTREQLTVERGDFASAVGLLELALRVSEQLDVALGIEHTSRTVDSAMREWLTADDQPIRQSSEFSRTRFLASGKVYLLPRGRAISRFSWVPNRWSPYIGGGGGISSYEFVQRGDFVDVETLDIYELELPSAGTGLTAHALVGGQLSLSPRLLLRGEYRYLWGSAGVDQDVFEGFDDINLSGSRVLLGLSVRL